MPILDVRPDDWETIEHQLGEFKGMTGMLDSIVRDLTTARNTIYRARTWTKGLGPEYDDLLAFLTTIESAISHSQHRVSVVSSVFEELWDIGEALRRVYRRRKVDPPILDLSNLNFTIGHPPKDNEIKNLLDE